MFSRLLNKKNNLRDIREELDHLDDVIMGLLEKRYKLIQRAGGVKNLDAPREPLMRISREAQIIRRLVKEHNHKSWSPLVIARVWWLLMASARALEGEQLHVALIAQDKKETMLHLASIATQRYGVGEYHPTTLPEAIDGLREKRYTIALLPYPRKQEWEAFLQAFIPQKAPTPTSPHMIDALPTDLLPMQKPHHDDQHFLALGCSKPRESEQDLTLIALKKATVPSFLATAQDKSITTKILWETTQWTIIQCETFVLPHHDLLQKHDQSSLYWLGLYPVLPSLKEGPRLR